jgi:hypothetical protein
VAEIVKAHLREPRLGNHEFEELGHVARGVAAILIGEDPARLGVGISPFLALLLLLVDGFSWACRSDPRINRTTSEPNFRRRTLGRLHLFADPSVQPQQKPCECGEVRVRNGPKDRWCPLTERPPFSCAEGGGLFRQLGSPGLDGVKACHGGSGVGTRREVAVYVEVGHFRRVRETCFYAERADLLFCEHVV